MTDPSSAPNVLLVHCHDLGRHLGCYGRGTVSSPHLDALAADGVLVEQMYAAAPQCSPSRAALFTGRWPHRNGVLGLTHDHFGWDLHPDETHLATRLRGVGFGTELVGVHHESATRPDDEVAARLGFDRVRTGGRADVVTANGIDALHRLAEDDRPFYLQVGYHEPHRIPGARDPEGTMGFLGDDVEPDDSRGVEVPDYLDDTASARAEIAELQGAIKALDAGVGKLLAELDALGLTDDTVVIFTTDHGLALPRAKCSLYDPGLEIAFIARWPNGGWTGGRRYAGLVGNVDVVPTLLDAVGAEPADALDGASFAASLRDPDVPSEEMVFGEMTYHDYYDPRRCVRTTDHKLVANFSSAPAFMDPSQSWARRCHPKALTTPHTLPHPPVELYDLRSDPGERQNLADHPEHAATLQSLLAALRTWMEQTDDPLLAGAVTGPLHRSTLQRLG